MLIERIIEELAKGNFVLVYDVDGREEEVDLVCLADKVTPKHVYTLRHDAGGLICVAMHRKIADRLGLPFMADIFSKVLNDYSIFHKLAPDVACPYGDKPSFSVTVNHNDTYTGITDRDRALTISEFGNLGGEIYRNGGSLKYREKFQSSFRAPGHTHLLIAAQDLLNERLGHTELTVSLAYLGGLTPVTVLCEMLDGETGKALSLKKAREYAEKHGLLMIEGNEIIEAFKNFKNARS